MILKKGYYVVKDGTEIVSGQIDTPEEAEAAWEEARRGAQGSKFFIVWIPRDNYAWGE